MYSPSRRNDRCIVVSNNTPAVYIIYIYYIIYVYTLRVQLEYDGSYMLHYTDYAQCSTTPGRNTKGTDEGLAILLLCVILCIMYKVWAKQISHTRAVRSYG